MKIVQFENGPRALLVESDGPDERRELLEALMADNLPSTFTQQCSHVRAGRLSSLIILSTKFIERVQYAWQVEQWLLGVNVALEGTRRLTMDHLGIHPVIDGANGHFARDLRFGSRARTADDGRTRGFITQICTNPTP
jgi:hypothetical protein